MLHTAKTVVSAACSIAVMTASLALAPLSTASAETALEKGKALFDATLSLERVPITKWRLTSVLARYPAMTVKVVAAIYWQALKLKWKKAPFFPHPDKVKGQLEKV